MTLLHRIAHPHPLALFALSYILFLHGQCHNSFVFFSLLAIHCTLRFYQCKLCSEDISVRKSRLIKMNLIEILEHEKKVEHLFFVHLFVSGNIIPHFLLNGSHFMKKKQKTLWLIQTMFKMFPFFVRLLG